MREVELWRVRKEEWELRCVAVYLPSGIDVRLMEGDDFRRTRHVRDAIECTALSDQWKQKLTAVGWTTWLMFSIVRLSILPSRHLSQP